MTAWLAGRGRRPQRTNSDPILDHRPLNSDLTVGARALAA
jgi:hypothetical protein